MKIKQTIKRLLVSGRSEKAIAKELSVSVYKVNKIKREIIRDKRKWNKKRSVLEDHQNLIMNCLLKKQPVRQIHLALLSLNVNRSYSAVARFASVLRKKYEAGNFPAIPGAEAKVFFTSIGKFKNKNRPVDAWLFIMRFTYSRYSYYELITDKSFDGFLKCHKKAFTFFEGVPLTIRVNLTSAFDMNNLNTRTRYTYFLYCFGCSLTCRTVQHCPIRCNKEIRFFKENFLATVLHKNFAKLSGQLKGWFTTGINLRIHPVTGRMIKKEFLHSERPQLFPVNPYHI